MQFEQASDGDGPSTEIWMMAPSAQFLRENPQTTRSGPLSLEFCKQEVTGSIPVGSTRRTSARPPRSAHRAELGAVPELLTSGEVI